MTITTYLFEAHLSCPTKCWLRSTNEPTADNAYTEWVQTQNELYRADAARQLVASAPADECAVATSAENLKAGRWRLLVDVPVRIESRNSRGNEAQTSMSEIDQSLLTSAATSAKAKCTFESRLHAIERILSEGRGKPAQFIPIRFMFTNKLGKDDKLLLAFDAFALSEVLGREVRLGKIIHGDDHATLKVKTSALAGEVRKRFEQIAALLSNPAPPDLVLNRHCPECEFQARCRKIAVEKDDLSLLASMSAKERQKLRSKGIFTVTQLSYTFRPRRRPKRLRGKREKYHHSLKALAIREKKIHIVGSPELKMEGTPVYLDVEGLPDSDFYYLIGLRIGNGDSAVQHSLWADTVEDEGKIWREFLGILETVEKPVLIHYGSYETTFLEQMQHRYGSPPEGSSAAKGIQSPMNILTVIVGQVYFPTYSNGIKDIASWLDFAWNDPALIGANSIACRSDWQRSKDSSSKIRLVTYNANDCQAAEIVATALTRLHPSELRSGSCAEQSPVAVDVTSLKRPHRRFGPFASTIQGFEQINQAAWWNYQRDRIYVKSSVLAKSSSRRSKLAGLSPHNGYPVNKVVVCPAHSCCPFCGAECLSRSLCTRTLHDICFGKASVKRWIVEYRFRNYWCPRCQRRFGAPEAFWPQSKYGRNLVAYLLYEAIDLCIPILSVAKTLNRFFGLAMPQRTFYALRDSAAAQYKITYERIIGSLVTGNLLHIDETQVSIEGKSAYVWVFASLHEVAYVYSDTREGDLLHNMLKEFKGVVVSDFYGAYDSLTCPQQKCLVHLMRDLNDEVLSHPYDERLKEIVMDFGTILKAIVETLDRCGLKARFLRKHCRSVDGFFKRLSKSDCQTEAALKCKQRFEKNREKLFTFLSHDSVPWNNNNAEHAVRGFARLRDILGGKCTANAVQKYLVLLSVCQTCKYMGVDFLDFLRSGEKDIHAFAESRRGRRTRTQTIQPPNLPANGIPDSDGGSRDRNVARA